MRGWPRWAGCRFHSQEKSCPEARPESRTYLASSSTRRMRAFRSTLTHWSPQIINVQVERLQRLLDASVPTQRYQVNLWCGGEALLASEVSRPSNIVRCAWAWGRPEPEQVDADAGTDKETEDGSQTRNQPSRDHWKSAIARPWTLQGKGLSWCSDRKSAQRRPETET